MGRMLTMIAAALGLGAAAEPASAQDCDPVETTTLLADDGAADDGFGRSVSLDGNTAIVGIPFHDDNGTSSGSAFVFVRSGDAWTKQAELLPDDGVEDDRFGDAVAISGDTAIIGAHGDNEAGEDYGSAYIFVRDGEVWTEQAELLAPDGAMDDGFGHAVAIDGDTAIVGAYGDDDNGSFSGSAYIYTRSEGLWTFQAKLLPDDGGQLHYFGIAVSISGETAIIGSYKGFINSAPAGSAYIFTRSGSVWTQQARLLPDDGERNDYFGWSVSLDGDTALIGAYRSDGNEYTSGSAYIFTRSGDIWTQQAKLWADDGARSDSFGWAVSLHGNTAVLGAPGDDDNGSSSGSAYIFTRNENDWTQQHKLLPADGAEADRFGETLSMSHDTALIGAHQDDDNGTDSGSAFLFNLGCIDCPADLNDDGIVDTRDFVLFVGAWAAGDPLADWDENGIVDTRDFIAYLGDWTAGCP